MLRLLFCLTLMSSLLPLPASAAKQLYRFNVDGRVIVIDNVPADLAPLGYEVLNSQGLVLKVVPRELTAAEIAERDRRVAEQKAREQRIAKQREADNALLRLYATPEDADRALKRKTDDVQAHIELQQRRKADMQEKLQRAQQQAANVERQGREVGPELRADIALITNGLEDAKQKIAQRQEEKARLQQEFATLRRRIEFLQDHPPGTLPEEIAAE